MRGKLFLSALLVCLSVPAFAQGPRVEISGGYSFLRDQDVEKNFHGWVGSVAGNYNKWFGTEAEIGGNYKTTQLGGTDVDLSVHSFLGGPRFTVRTHEGLELIPFAHFLIGSVRSNASVLGASASTWDFALQPGGGIDYWFRPKMAVRVGGDYRRIFYQGAGANEFGFNVGIVLGLGRL
jgi:hypothetical protein